MPSPYRYRRRLPHLQPDDSALFVTFRTFPGVFLSSKCRDIVLAHCRREDGRRVRLHAAVVLPDHVHLLMTPLRDQSTRMFPLRSVVQAIKSASAHRINTVLQRAGPVWDEEFFDHAVRSYDKLEEKLEYIRQNPVNRGLVRQPERYRWLWVAPRIS